MTVVSDSSPSLSASNAEESRGIRGHLYTSAADLFKQHHTTEALKACADHPERLRKSLWRMMGVVYDSDLSLSVRWHGSIVCAGYRIEHIAYQSRPNFYVTASLYIPDGEGPFPAVVNTHGHFAQGRRAERVQSRGHALALSGYVCLSIDAFGSGDRSKTLDAPVYHGGHLGMGIYDIGETLLGIQVVDNMRGVDLLTQLSYVDSARIGATGASGGGNQAMWLSAMDTRIKSAVIVVNVGTYECCCISCNCVCETLPDVMTVAEQAQILGLIAPRPLLICSNSQDMPWFHPDEMKRSYRGAKVIYQFLKASDHIKYAIFDRPHGYYPEIREAMLGWMRKTLKGKGDGAPMQEPEFAVLDEARMSCFTTGERDEGVWSISNYVKTRCQAIEQEVHEALTHSRQSKILSLSHHLKDVDFSDYQPENLNASFLDHNSAGDQDVVTMRLRTPQGEVVYISYHEEMFARTAPVAPRIVCHFSELGNGPEDEVRVLLYGFGPTAWPNEGVGLHHDISRSYLFQGKTLMGAWVRQWMCLMHWLKEACAVRSISARADDCLGLVPLLANCFDLYVHELVTPDHTLANHRIISPEKGEDTSMGIHVPGFIPWGGVPMAEALFQGRRVGGSHSGDELWAKLSP